MADGHRADPQLTRQVEAALARIVAGDQSAYDDLIPLIYDELRLVARHLMRRERPTTPCRPPPWSTRPASGCCVWPTSTGKTGPISSGSPPAPCAASSSTTPRGRNRQRRGGGEEPLPLDEIERQGAAFFEYPDLRILDLDTALNKLRPWKSASRSRRAALLRRLDPRGAAEVLGVSRRPSSGLAFSACGDPGA